MCGIAGFIGPWNDQLLNHMLDSIAHRGPDGRGKWRDPAAGAVLGHVRLSIIDLSTASNQPMLSADGRYAISYNGEIYNYRALRRELEAKGARFRTQSDTEVLLELIARDGETALSRIEGIFAFAFWDRDKRSLLIARDQLGVKPLYYSSLPQGFLFASELKALATCPDVPRDIDPEAVINHVSFLWSNSTATMLKSAKKLRPGHYMRVEADCSFKVHQYYQVPIPSKSPSRVRPDELLEIFDRVVADQMVADVPVGAFLSGGVDSSAIVASMCKAADPARITTFCAKVPVERGRADNFGDDIIYAREMAAKLGVKLVEVSTDSNLVDNLPGMLWDLDEPTADFAALQTRHISAEARKHGVKVLLSGTGGDDLFSGYGRHVATNIWHTLDRVPGGRAIASAIVANIPSTSLLGRRLSRLGELLKLDEEDMLVEAMSFSTFPPDKRLGLIAPGLRNGLNARRSGAMTALLEKTRGLHPVERQLQFDLDGFLPDLNLNYADKMAMQEAVELRVPLLDPRLVAFAMNIPTSQKISLRETKKILREAMKDRLTPGILNRPKQGFGAPVRAWLAGPARDILEDTTSRAAVERRGLFDSEAVRGLRAAFDTRQGDVAFTLFTLVAIELWCRALDAHPAPSALKAHLAA